MPLAFEWNDQKASENLRRHGVSFELAMKVFDDPFAIERIDDRYDYGEERLAIVGMVRDDLLFVVYTERNDRIRLISARRATNDEQDDYFRQTP
jgi:uncharacterized DUF497 family protein